MNESNENESMIPEETAPAVEEITAEEKPEKEETPGGEEEKKPGAVGFLYDMVEMLGLVSVALMLIFAFVIRLNVVDGDSMKQTLHDGEYLVVAELCYTPARGDIVVIHDVTAKPYDNPIVKRVIATAGQTVDIDFDTWTLTVDGEVVDESAYRYLNGRLLRSEYSFPITVPEGEIFVLGDNRNNSADSRQVEIGTVDVRCVVGRAVCRLLPPGEFKIFSNPYAE